MKLLLATLLFASPVFAGTDYNCLNKCTATGAQYGLCQKKCSYDEPKGFGSFNDGKQTDYQCVNQCTQGGSMYNFCVDKCSY